VTGRADVLAALSEVRDPELDEPVTELGFVAGVEVRGAEVAVRLRLPTYFCAPNFTWMMAADAEAAVGALPGVEHVRVSVDDHFVSEEIDAGLAAGSGFRDAFAGFADGELDELRTLFARKAFLARQYAACAPLLAAGRAPAELAALALADLPGGDEAVAYARRRAELGLATDPAAPLLVTPAGAPVPPEGAERHLRFARATQVSIEGNAGLCRGLLETRYSTNEETVTA
jgi:metal-sulfur cluster biosynthetic enzyme